MTSPGYRNTGNDPTRRLSPRGDPLESQRAINVGRLWAGGLGTAVVAGLVVVVGILLVRGVLDIPVLSPSDEGTYGDANTTSYALGTIGIGVLATGLLHLLLLAMPRPMSFFNWIAVLGVAIAVLVPFTVNADTDAQLATAGINLAAGVCMIALLNTIAAAAMEDQSKMGP